MKTLERAGNLFAGVSNAEREVVTQRKRRDARQLSEPQTKLRRLKGTRECGVPTVSDEPNTPPESGEPALQSFGP